MINMLTAYVASHIESLKARDNDEGATMIEYGLIVAAIAVVVGVAATALGTRVSGLFANILPAAA
jgi:pilus assembly protein Flp/PilA